MKNLIILVIMLAGLAMIPRFIAQLDFSRIIPKSAEEEQRHDKKIRNLVDRLYSNSSSKAPQNNSVKDSGQKKD